MAHTGARAGVQVEGRAGRCQLGAGHRPHKGTTHAARSPPVTRERTGAETAAHAA